MQVFTPSPPALGSMFSSGTSTSVISICPVTLARRENLPLITGAEVYKEELMNTII